MKKIIFACLVVPTMFISLAAFADTAEQIIIDAAKATIEQARKDGSAVVFTSNNAVKTMYTAGYQSPQMESYQSEVYLNLASLRYQAEVYHSMKNNYGAATNSCSQGIFAESGKNGGLKSIISNIFKQTKTVSCVAAASSKTNLGDAWMVIAKSDNKFMCVDSSGSVMLVGGMARKGITRCKDAPKTPATVMNSSVKTTFMLQPKTDGTFDSSYDIKMNKMGNISTYTEMTIKDITYKLIDNHFLKMLTSEAGAPISATVTAAIRGRYVSIHQNLSAIAYAYGKSSTELQKTVDVALNPKRFTAVYNRTTTTGEQMYTVSLPVSVLMRIARGSIGSGVESSPTSSLEDAIMKLDVKIKDGLITSITAPKQVLKWNTVTGTFTGSV